MGIIDLLMLQTDSQILELTNVFEDVQMAKHAVAHALGIYLMAICNSPGLTKPSQAARKRRP